MTPGADGSVNITTSVDVDSDSDSFEKLIADMIERADSIKLDLHHSYTEALYDLGIKQRPRHHLNEKFTSPPQPTQPTMGIDYGFPEVGGTDVPLEEFIKPGPLINSHMFPEQDPDPTPGSKEETIQHNKAQEG